jgi:hypothetical protein
VAEYPDLLLDLQVELALDLQDLSGIGTGFARFKWN